MSPQTATLEPQPNAALTGVLRVSLMSLVLFCIGHFAVDMYSSALGALQPRLIEQFRLTFTQAGILGGVLSFSASVMQPLYGYLSDRFHSRLFTALAPAVAGIFISGLGWASGYPMLLAMVFLGGAGIASFHPQATSNATAGINKNHGRAMAIFISSGTLGLAVGPTLFSEVTGKAGLRGGLAAAIPGILLTGLLLFFLPPVRRSAVHGKRFDFAPLRAVWKPMTILYVLVFIRSVVQVTFTQFLPLYLNTQRGYTVARSSYALSGYLLAGAFGGIAGGNLADRFGGKRVIVFSMIGCAPFLALFLFTTGIASLAGLLLGGLILLFTIPVNVMMAQQLAPSQTGTVSALMMGFAWGTAGLMFIPFTGWMADHYSMQAAFAVLCVFPVIGFFLALKLKLPA
jgi:FSR family fosmidomycin resistance protein-like MFS transporter